MLVLSRKSEERIIITAGEDEIVITFFEYAHGQARFGIEAAKHVKVNREEVQDAIERAVRRGGKSRY